MKIEKMVYGGYGLAHENGKTYLVENAYPNEIVEVEVKKEKNDVAFCKAKKVIKASKDRIIPACSHYHECGGCEWMNVRYEKQLEYKQQIFVEQMKRIAKMDVALPEIIPTHQLYYRNKVEYVIREGKLGYFKKKSHEFVKINECKISTKKLNDAKERVEEVLKTHRRFSSKLERVVLRNDQDHTMVIFVSDENLTPPEIEGIDGIVILKDSSHIILAGKEKFHKGLRKLEFEINSIKYEIPPKAFFQVNYKGAEVLASLVKEWTKNGESALDLYCGVGFFSLQIHKNFEKVTGVEGSPSSIKIAKENAKINKVANCEFVAKKVEDWHTARSYDVVVLDPPRSGLKKGVVEKASSLAKKRIIYVSCNSSTFARDVRLFEENGFHLKKAKLIDMFPQTHHFEIVSTLEK